MVGNGHTTAEDVNALLANGDEQPDFTPAPRPRKKAPARPASDRVLSVTERMPPNDRDAERGVLASLLLDPSQAAGAFEAIKVGDFYDPAHRTIFAAMLAAGTSDLTLVLGRLREGGALESIGGAAYLSDLFDSHPVAAHLPHYADRVREMATRRRVKMVGERLLLSAYESGSAAEIVTGARADLEDLDAKAAQSEFTSLDLATLFATDFTVDMLVNGVLPAAQGGIMSGVFKSGKTGVGLDLQLSLASGTPFLGYPYFDVPEPAPAGIFTCESGWPTIKQRCQAICRAKGIDTAELGKMFQVSTELPRLAIMPELKKLERFIVKWALRCVAIDPSYLAFSDAGDSVSNVFKMGSALLPLTDLIQRTGCTILLLNHNRKNRPDRGRFSPPDLGEISQSGFAEWLRFYLLLGHREEWNDEIGQFKLWLRSGGSIGHGGLHNVDITEGKPTDPGGRSWAISVEPAAQAAREDKDEKAAAREKREQQEVRDAETDLLKFLYRQPERRAVDSKIKNEVSRSKAMVKAITSVEKQGIIRTCFVIGGNGHKTAAWELTDRDGLETANDTDQIDHVDHADGPTPGIDIDHADQIDGGLIERPRRQRRRSTKRQKAKKSQ